MKSPGQTGSCELGFGTLQYEQLFLDEIPEALALVGRAEDLRVESNQINPPEAVSWNRSTEVDLRASAKLCFTLLGVDRLRG